MRESGLTLYLQRTKAPHPGLTLHATHDSWETGATIGSPAGECFVSQVRHFQEEEDPTSLFVLPVRPRIGEPHRPQDLTRHYLTVDQPRSQVQDTQWKHGEDVESR